MPRDVIVVPSALNDLRCFSGVQCPRSEVLLACQSCHLLEMTLPIQSVPELTLSLNMQASINLI